MWVDPSPLPPSPSSSFYFVLTVWFLPAAPGFGFSNSLRQVDAVRGKREQQDERSLSQQLHTSYFKSRLWQHSQPSQKGMRVLMCMYDLIFMLNLWGHLVQICLPTVWACSIVNVFTLHQIVVVLLPTSHPDTMTSSMLRRQLKNLVQNYSEAEVKVRVTCNLSV